MIVLNATNAGVGLLFIAVQAIGLMGSGPDRLYITGMVIGIIWTLLAVSATTLAVIAKKRASADE
jgi:hypothetical protein